jgi:hypothetical protein
VRELVLLRYTPNGTRTWEASWTGEGIPGVNEFEAGLHVETGANDEIWAGGYRFVAGEGQLMALTRWTSDGTFIDVSEWGHELNLTDRLEAFALIDDRILLAGSWGSDDMFASDGWVACWELALLP